MPLYQALLVGNDRGSPQMPCRRKEKEVTENKKRLEGFCPRCEQAGLLKSTIWKPRVLYLDSIGVQKPLESYTLEV
jgi:Zn finger protein HypA/HybF involved in hydrogenase expression